MINFGCAFIALKYEMAIILPKDETAAINIFSLSILVSICISFLLLLIGICFHNFFNHQFQLQGWLWLPAVILNLLLYNFYQSTFFWCSRKKMFNNIVFNRILQNGLIIIAQLLFAIFYFKSSNGLLLGRTVGLLISAIIFGKILLQPMLTYKKNITIQSLKAQAVEYISFPKHIAVSQSMAVFYAQIPVWFITAYFNKSTAGNFSLAFQIVTIPTALVVTSLGDTFRQYATDLFHQTGRFDKLLISTIKKSFLIGIIPFALFFFFAQNIFDFFYRPEWHDAGKMAAILSLMVMINVITNPVDNSAIIVQKTKFVFFWHLSRLLFNIYIAWLCKYLNQSVYFYLYALVLVNIFHYLINVFFMYKFSKGENR
jgi:O-antigen/teichoic acid export membrane protein